ncbi:MAG TPA: hypothetical protein VM204_07040, partial [Gaiellaceae bacterium]|nr:hypothetical protein [Gaiellaceae bacterium]
MAPFAQDEERLRRLQSLTDAALAHLDLDALLAELLVRARRGRSSPPRAAGTRPCRRRAGRARRGRARG